MCRSRAHPLPGQRRVPVRCHIVTSRNPTVDPRTRLLPLSLPQRFCRLWRHGELCCLETGKTTASPPLLTAKASPAPPPSPYLKGFAVSAATERFVTLNRYKPRLLPLPLLQRLCVALRQVQTLASPPLLTAKALCCLETGTNP